MDTILSILSPGNSHETQDVNLLGFCCFIVRLLHEVQVAQQLGPRHTSI
jgi:hypothetical protein